MNDPRRRTRPHLLGELAVVALLLFGYDRLTDLVGAGVRSAVHNGWAVLSLERRLHVAAELPVNRALAGWRGLGQAVSVYYDFAHGLVTIGVVLLVYLAAPGSYRRARRALVGTNVVAFAVFVVFPVVPPRLLPGGGFTDVVGRSGTVGAWEASGSGLARHADQLASMPSLHVAWALWVVLTAWSATRSPWLRSLAAAHAAVTAVIVVATGNHYLLDVLAGALLAVLAWTVAGLSWAAVRAVLPVRPVPAR